jgi:uncharacterized membrane protein
MMMNETLPPTSEPFDLHGETPSPTSNDKLLAGLSYVSQIVLPAVLPAILLLGGESKRSAFIRHHAISSLGLLVAAVLYEILASIVFVVVSALVPCFSCAVWLIFFLPLIPIMYYGYQALQGQQVDIPWLTRLLKKNALL